MRGEVRERASRRCGGYRALVSFLELGVDVNASAQRLARHPRDDRVVLGGLAASRVYLLDAESLTAVGELNVPEESVPGASALAREPRVAPREPQ